MQTVGIKGSASPPRELLLVLTAACNLRCSYCYQRRTRAGAMPWPTVEASLDLFLASRNAEMVSMTGGEPLLEFDTIRRIVGYVKAHGRPGRPIAFHLVSNGVLLAQGARGRAPGGDVSFLVENDVALDVSIDGAREAQELRAPGTFAWVDALLDTLRGAHPDYFRRRLLVSLTLSRAAIPHFGASIDYLIGKQVPEIVIQPAIGDEAWTGDDLARLDVEMAHAWHSSLVHYLQTGQVAIARFRPAERPGHGARWACSAPLGGAIAVDVDGSVHPCALLARSYNRFSEGLERRLAFVSLGKVRDDNLARRLTGLAQGARRSGVFEPKRKQHAAPGRCADCALVDDCFVCPVARAMDAPDSDVNRVPDSWCAFNRVLLKYRSYLPIQSTRAATLAALAARLRSGHFAADDKSV